MNKKKVYSKALIWEKTYPFFFSIFFFLLYLMNEQFCWVYINLQELIKNSLNLFGVLLGFLITVLTIINSLDNIYIRKLRTKDSYQFLIDYLKIAIKVSVLMLVFAILYLSFQFGNDVVEQSLDYAAVFVFLLALFTTYRFIDVFLHIINTEKT